MVEEVTPGLGGVPQILSDREDQRIFWGLNSWFQDLLGKENFGMYFLG